MFFEEILLYLAESAWTLILHLSARNSFPKPLQPEEEAELVERMLAGDTLARDRLIEHNLRLVAHIAKKYAAAGESDDLISIGSIGLIKAVHTFRPEAGRLTTYASRDREGNEVQLCELLGTDRDMVPDEVALRMDSATALKLIDRVLESREARVIRLRYGLEDGNFHPQHEVAAILNISRSYVSRIEKKALAKLRARME